MTKDEALRMAIEALETSDAIVAEYSGVHFERIQPAIQACKEALAETQEPVLYIDGGGLDGHATWAQAIRCQDTDIALYTHPSPQPTAEQSSLVQEPMIIKQENGMVLKLGYDELPNGTAFYTTPSREWVGLSDEEIEGLDSGNQGITLIARAIEAKLREKNK